LPLMMNCTTAAMVPWRAPARNTKTAPRIPNQAPASSTSFASPIAIPVRPRSRRYSTSKGSHTIRNPPRPPSAASRCVSGGRNEVVSSPTTAPPREIPSGM
jgi:hypothetical protein